MAKTRKTILFRCELDALPIHEINTFEHRSLTNGVSHKCGHDGHMAILCGLAIELHRQSQNRESYSIIPTC
jgi:metal-dependent amidase/aminoacylase/carboxypeptidase family protein